MLKISMHIINSIKRNYTRVIKLLWTQIIYDYYYYYYSYFF